MSPVCPRPYRPHQPRDLCPCGALCHLTRPWNDPYRDIDRKLAVDAGPRGHRNDRRSVVVPAPDGNCLTPIENSTGFGTSTKPELEVWLARKAKPFCRSGEQRFGREDVGRAGWCIHHVGLVGVTVGLPGGLTRYPADGQLSLRTIRRPGPGGGAVVGCGGSPCC